MSSSASSCPSRAQAALSAIVVGIPPPDQRLASPARHPGPRPQRGLGSPLCPWSPGWPLCQRGDSPGGQGGPDTIREQERQPGPRCASTPAGSQPWNARCWRMRSCRRLRLVRPVPPSPTPPEPTESRGPGDRARAGGGAVVSAINSWHPPSSLHLIDAPIWWNGTPSANFQMRLALERLAYP